MLITNLEIKTLVKETFTNRANTTLNIMLERLLSSYTELLTMRLKELSDPLDIREIIEQQEVPSLGESLETLKLGDLAPLGGLKNASQDEGAPEPRGDEKVLDKRSAKNLSSRP